MSTNALRWFLTGSPAQVETVLFSSLQGVSHYKKNHICVAGQRLSSEHMSPAVNMYNEVMDGMSLCASEEPRWTSVGHVMRSEVLLLQVWIPLNDFV